MKKYCSCGRLIDVNSKCDRCSKDRHREYNKRRDKIKDSFYRSKSWIKLRDYIRVRDKGLCLMCLDSDEINEMRVVHHIEPYEDSEELRLDENNLICLCQRCHELVHEEYKANKKPMQDKLRRMIGLV